VLDGAQGMPNTVHASAVSPAWGGVHTGTMLRHLHLRTTDLLLRPIAPSDRADLVALEADPLVMRYLDGGQKVPPEVCQARTF